MIYASYMNTASTPSVPTTFDADVGSATPAANILNLLGTANQVTTTAAGNTVTFSLPQSIATTSTPTFGGLTINGFQVLKMTSPGAYPYNVLTTDFMVLVDSAGGARTIRLPNAPTTGQNWVIKDDSGNAAANNISVTTVGGVVTIDGIATQTITGNWESINVAFNGTSYRIF